MSKINKRHGHFYIGLCHWRGDEELDIYYVTVDHSKELLARFQAGHSRLEATMDGKVVRCRGFSPEEVAWCLDYLAELKDVLIREALKWVETRRKSHLRR